MEYKDLSSLSIKELADRMNQIMVEQDKLAMEHNRIVQELWERVPSLKESPDIQYKKVRVNNE